MFIPELHEVITSSLSFRSMLELAYQGVKTVVVMVVVFAKNVLWFAFNSVFPPVLDEVTPPQPPSEINSDMCVYINSVRSSEARLWPSPRRSSDSSACKRWPPEAL